MAKQIIKGDDLMVFDSYGRSMAYATSHTLTISADVTEVNSKDHGIYGGKEVNKINWEITTENLYTTSAFRDLFDAMMNRQPVRVFWGGTSENRTNTTGKNVVDGDYDNWTPWFAGADSVNDATESPFVGNAYITSLTANANTGENATFSATFTGSGKFKLVEDVADLNIPAANSEDWASVHTWETFNADGTVYNGGTLTPAPSTLNDNTTNP